VTMAIKQMISTDHYTHIDISPCAPVWSANLISQRLPYGGHLIVDTQRLLLHDVCLHSLIFEPFRAWPATSLAESHSFVISSSSIRNFHLWNKSLWTPHSVTTCASYRSFGSSQVSGLERVFSWLS